MAELTATERGLLQHALGFPTGYRNRYYAADAALPICRRLQERGLLYENPRKDLFSGGAVFHATDSAYYALVDKDYQLVQARTCDLWHDGFGWGENAPLNSGFVFIPAKATDLAVARMLKRRLNIIGWRVDQWCSADWCWRSGSTGAYADVVATYEGKEK